MILQLTHEQLAILYEQQTGVKINESTVGRALARIRKVPLSSLFLDLYSQRIKFDRQHSFKQKVKYG